MSRNDQLFDRAQRVIPGGVNSPVRAFRSVGGVPYFVARAQGPYVWDADGAKYIDYVQSYGASIVGHAHPKIIEAIRAAAADGTTYGAPTAREVELAETLCDAVSGLDMVRLVSSGTEAAMSAIRLARGATGRDAIVKFSGCYHGHSDNLLAAGGSGVANQGLSGCDGVTAGAVADTIVAPYNVVPALDERVAAVIVEPVAANMGLVAPVAGFLEGLRRECDRVGALLIYDEVITGFRLCRGGAAQWFGVRPDLWCFGKVIGGGLPIGAFGGRRDVMQHLAPLGGVYQAGTLSGNPLATAAGLAVLELLDDDAFAQLDSIAARLGKGLHDALEAAGNPAVLPRVGPLVGLFFADHEPVNFDEADVAARNGRYATAFHELLRQGVAFAPGPYEILFPSLAHDDDVLEATFAAAAATSRRG
ncbi:MAG: glutamate-1-semialdehyde 2,1-aminomutase [Acidimicrobiales bacterium]